jgi:hypothetical protein
MEQVEPSHWLRPFRAAATTFDQPPFTVESAKKEETRRDSTESNITSELRRFSRNTSNQQEVIDWTFIYFLEIKSLLYPRIIFMIMI